MNRLLTTALLAVAAGLSAGLPTSGLPSGNPELAIHLSNETLDQTQVGKSLTSVFQAEINEAAKIAALRTQLGFNLDEDLRDFTLVGQVSQKTFSALIRGKFNKARIEDFATQNKVSSRAVGSLKAWDTRELNNAIMKGVESPVVAAPGAEPTYVVIVDGNTAVLADGKSLDRAVAAAAAGAPWKNEGLSRAAASVQNGWALIAADVAAIEEAETAKRMPEEDASPEAKAALAKRSGAKVVTFAAGENTTDVTLRVHADFVDEAAAKKNVAQIKGMLGFGAMLTMPSETDTAEQSANKATGADLLRRITVTQSGAAADANLDYPIQKLAQAIVRAGEIRRQKQSGPKGK